MAEVVYDSASRIYTPGARPAVNQLNLNVDDGEFVVFVGPSGCGKSTALRMLAGLEEIDGGQIRIGGKNMVGVPSRERDIAMVFQNYALYPNKTVGENMDFPLKMRGLPKSERDEKVRAAAETLGLTEFLDRKPGALSGGQRQRVAMGRAIVREPQVFLMDEPLSNLDAKMRVGTRAEIAALQQRLGVTTIYVTHDQVEAMTMGNRVAVLKLGELQQFASPAELYDKPGNAFVAGFIGSPAMNLYTVPLADGGARLGGAVVPLTGEQRAALERAGLSTVTLGIRPEQWTANGDSPANGTGEGIAAEVTVVEELGSDAFLYGNLATEPEQGIVVRAPGRSGARIGDKITLRTISDQLHLFHPDTGERM
ncbi:sn-glycerol-3-phosphate ABC transporter ATP-binding protein UgpC [Pseudonocardia eucalypti]|uniref:Sn-glycerol-3-phosphate ABC transporter ATP-binding protein UgpC n=1 Tax=Pseudonocardia eucalypti TaxID=648755 RepID=A0ABP9PPT2_9PSEU|nr:multiple sugar transport system ATP-binding protein [Pseudonocardia eucalypti]